MDASDHLPDADYKTIHRKAAAPKRTAEYLESLLAETVRELAEARADNEKLRARLTRHPEKD